MKKCSFANLVTSPRRGNSAWNCSLGILHILKHLERPSSVEVHFSCRMKLNRDVKAVLLEQNGSFAHCFWEKQRGGLKPQQDKTCRTRRVGWITGDKAVEQPVVVRHTPFHFAGVYSKVVRAHCTNKRDDWSWSRNDWNSEAGLTCSRSRAKRADALVWN